MLKKFCPKCGKITSNFFENLCLECFVKKIEIKHEKIEINQCPLCKDFIFKSKNFKEIDEVLNKIFKKLFKKLPVSEICYYLKNGEICLKLKIKIKGKEFVKEKSLKYKIKKTYCKYCRLKIGKYYEAILQFRNIRKEEIEEIKELIARIEKKDRMAFITKETILKNGFDLYIGSKKAASKIARFAKLKYSAKIKITRKFYGFKNGKKIYRVTFLIDFGKNERK